MTMSTRLNVRAFSDPQTLPRLANYAAQLGHVPLNFNASIDDEMICVSMELQGLSDQQVDIVAEKMRSSVLVQSVLVTPGRPRAILAHRAQS